MLQLIDDVIDLMSSWCLTGQPAVRERVSARPYLSPQATRMREGRYGQFGAAGKRRAGFRRRGTIGCGVDEKNQVLFPMWCRTSPQPARCRACRQPGAALIAWFAVGCLTPP